MQSLLPKRHKEIYIKKTHYSSNQSDYHCVASKSQRNLFTHGASAISLSYASAKDTAYLVCPQKYLIQQHTSFIYPMFQLQ